MNKPDSRTMRDEDEAAVWRRVFESKYEVPEKPAIPRGGNTSVQHTGNRIMPEETPVIADAPAACLPNELTMGYAESEAAQISSLVPYNAAPMIQKNNELVAFPMGGHTAGELEACMHDSRSDAAYYRRLARNSRRKKETEVFMGLSRLKTAHIKKLAAALYILTGIDPVTGVITSDTHIVGVRREAIRNMCIHERQDADRYMQISINSRDPVIARMCAEFSRECEKASDKLRELL